MKLFGVYVWEEESWKMDSIHQTADDAEFHKLALEYEDRVATIKTIS